MSIISQQQRLRLLGSSASAVEATQNFLGAVVNRVGVTVQFVPQLILTAVEFNTTVYDVGGWFNNSGPTNTFFTVPEGVSRVRFFVSTEFDSVATSFLAGDAVQFGPVLNGVPLQGYGLMSYSLSNVNANQWLLKTPPIECAVGDEFGVSVLATVTPAIIVLANSARMAMGIEAVTGG